MSEIVVNTIELEKNIEKLTEAKNYYSSKKSAFGLTMYESVSELSSALASIQSSYEDLYENIGLIENLIKDYKNDVEAIESRLSSASGNVRDASTAGVVNKGINSIVNKSIDASNIFVSNEEINNSVSNVNQTTTYENPYSNYTMGDWMMMAYNPEKYSPQAAKEVGATAVVASTSVLSGLGKIIESIGDSFSWMFAMNAVGNDYIYNNGDNVEELNKTIVNPIMDKIAVDYTGELNRKFYEETEFGKNVNDLSAIKYDSEEATAITDKSEKLFGTAIATGLTMLTGGLAPAFLVGFSYGSGKSAEKHFQDTDNRDFWKDSLNIGIDGAIEGFQFASKGKMGSNLVGNTANVVKVLPAVKEVYNAYGGGLSGALKVGGTFANEMFHLDQIGKTEINLIKTFGEGLGKTFIDTDVILETGAFLLDDVKGWIEVGEVTKEDVIGAVKQYGSVYWANLGANMLGAFAEAFSKNPSLKIDTEPTPVLQFDNEITEELHNKPFNKSKVGDTPTLGIDLESTPVQQFNDEMAEKMNVSSFSKNKFSDKPTQYKSYTDYDEFANNNKKNRESWEEKLKISEYRLLENYTKGEISSSSAGYTRINGLLRGDLVDYQNKTITIRYVNGTATFSFDEYAKYFLDSDESIEDYIFKIGNNAEKLNEIVSRGNLGENMILYRGVGKGTLERNFTIDFDNDSLESIISKINSGDGFYDKAFMSCSPVYDNGIFSTKDVMFLLYCDSDTPAIDLNSVNPSEHEILLGLGQKFDAIKAERVVLDSGKVQLQIHLKRK